MEAATIGEMADHFNRRVTTWCGSYIALNEAIKQLGDVAQWTQVVEADMDFIAKYVLHTITPYKRALYNIHSYHHFLSSLQSSRQRCTNT
jgi:nucleoside phosphorylase